MNNRARLAAVMARAFAPAKPAALTELRHAALAQKLGREITTSADLTDDEVESLLTQWERYDAPFSPSDAARKAITEFAKQYQLAHGQTELPLP